MPGSLDLAYWTIEEIARAISEGRTTSIAVTEHLLDRIAASQECHHGFVFVMRDQARAAARAADAELARGYRRGMLHGVPVAVKDLLATVDAPTASGSVALERALPDADATAVALLRRSGAIIIGKAQMTEGALLSHHPAIAAPRNPWDIGRCTGFSSSGSGVTVAAGLCYAALGSDTGGSIRIPSMMNGVTGIKPTWGRVSRYGAFPVVEALDAIGPLARSAADAAMVLWAISGADALDPTTSNRPVPNYLEGIDAGVGGMTIGVDWPLLEAACDAETVSMLQKAEAAFVSIGASVRAINMPSLDMLQIQPMVDASVARAHSATWPAQADSYGPALATALIRGPGTAMQVLDAIAAIIVARAQLEARLCEVDVILAPVLTTGTPEVGWFESQMAADPSGVLDALRFTTLVNAGGHPSIALPGGFDATGMPMGFQLIGRQFAEGTIIRAGHAYQRITDWHTYHPTM